MYEREDAYSLARKCNCAIKGQHGCASCCGGACTCYTCPRSSLHNCSRSCRLQAAFFTLHGTSHLYVGRRLRFSARGRRRAGIRGTLEARMSNSNRFYFVSVLALDLRHRRTSMH
jgi:hypothetical protein